MAHLARRRPGGRSGGRERERERDSAALTASGSKIKLDWSVKLASKV